MRSKIQINRIFGSAGCHLVALGRRARGRPGRSGDRDRRRYDRDPQHAHPAVGDRRAREHAALPWRRFASLSVRPISRDGAGRIVFGHQAARTRRPGAPQVHEPLTVKVARIVGGYFDFVGGFGLAPSVGLTAGAGILAGEAGSTLPL